MSDTTETRFETNSEEIIADLKDIREAAIEADEALQNLGETLSSVRGDGTRAGKLAKRQVRDVLSDIRREDKTRVRRGGR